MEEKTTQKKIFNSRPLFYGFLALMLAVCVSRYLFAGNVKYIVFIAIVLISFLVYCLIFKRYKILVFIFAVFLFGLGWFFVGQAGFAGKFYSGTCQIVGRIGDDIKYVEGSYNSRIEIVLKDVKINRGKDKNIALSVRCDKQNVLQEGDVVSFESELTNVHLFELGSFNLTAYRDKTPYSCTVDVSKISVVDNKLSADEKFRLKVKETLYDAMGKESGAVAYAVLFGDKNDVETDVKNNYKMSGIIHLLTVSGLHITFLISLIGFVLNKCKIKRWLNFAICVVFLGIYAWLCGWSPSVLRAGIMGIVLLFTSVTGKWYDNLSSMGFAGIIIILAFPLSALDNGFLMSFFCVGGIFIVAPWFSKLLRKVLPKFAAESFAISLSAQIMILPFMATFFSEINLLSFFVNLIVVPFFSVLYPLLFVFVLLCLALPFLSFLLKGCALGFGFIDKVAEFFASTKLIIKSQPIDIFISLFLFLFLFFMARQFMVSKKVKAVCCSGVFALCGIFMGISTIQMQARTSVLFCSWYDYSSILLTSKSGQTALVDATSYQSLYRLLQNEGLRSVDNYFLLNDSDINKTVSDEFSVNSIISLKGFADNEKSYLAEKNKISSVGDFSFQYVSSDSQLLGLEIVFDNFNLFVLYDDYLSESELLKLGEKSFDLVFVGENSHYSKYFDSRSVYGLYENENVDYNYNKNGNMKCVLKENELAWRCLD